ncbi:putative zinc finger protein [Fimicolochytrium jonesii]|uniref:putative zinc finger protein n=1 Tax=Fimicolochytrium jonesii TaxID=1396493 RepID=UPI0022FEA944|nr:putative zinc finger protein [Fimicolochytrium jonesii]KAI8815872.1 putative zinc finger protein [Fimicolochytrium jonesii]
MVRGAAKQQAREKNQKLAASKAGGVSQLKARAAGLPIVCPSCKGPMAGYKILVQHMESKHPGAAVPDEASFK